MKHTWTEAEDLSYIRRKNARRKKFFAAAEKKLIVKTHIEAVLASSEGE